MRSAFRSSACRVMAKPFSGKGSLSGPLGEGTRPFCSSPAKAEARYLPGRAAASAAGGSP